MPRVIRKTMRLYFMGICGTGMGNAALIAFELGNVVYGADSRFYPPMSEVLEDAAITVFEGYDAERLAKLAPDLVVLGNGVSRGHPEAEALLRMRSQRFTSLPAFLYEHVLRERLTIVAAGTHGKTTTTCMTAYLLKALGCEPGYLIGGVPCDLPAGARVGDTSAPFVIEGDEYDSAFFDKRSKFIHYAPQILIINNVEFDHADIFRDLEDVQRSFRHVLRLVPDNGFVLINGDDANCEALLPAPWTQVLRVGTGPGNDLRIQNFMESAEGSAFELHWRGQLWESVRLRTGGLYNARNAAMAALASGLALNTEHPTQISLKALAGFQGVKRRQEVLSEGEDWVVIEDFGHHPTAIQATLSSLRVRYPDYQISACFEPRSNSARTRVFQEGFTQALRQADRVFIAPVYRADHIPPEERLNTHQMARDLTRYGCLASASTDNMILLESAVTIYKQARKDKKQLFCFFSNGSFDGVMRALGAHFQTLHSSLAKGCSQEPD